MFLRNLLSGCFSMAEWVNGIRAGCFLLLHEARWWARHGSTGAKHVPAHESKLLVAMVMEDK